MRRAFTTILLVLEALFFNVVIPGHARGMIELPGSERCAACCAGKHSSQNKSPCDNQRAANCAICNFAAHVVVVPAVSFDLSPNGFVAFCNPSSPERVDVVAFPPNCLQRAPPLPLAA